METLKIDHWIYTIGERGGLYHQMEGHSPKRIHHSHPPQHHQEQVKQFQDAYRKKHGLPPLTRFETLQKAQTTSTKQECKQLTKQLQTLSVADTKCNEVKTNAKCNELKTDGLTVKTNPKARSSIKGHRSNVAVLELKNELQFPQSIFDIADNINKLQLHQFVPSWVQLQLARVFQLQQQTRCYYSHQQNWKQAQELTLYRSISPEIGFPEVEQAEIKEHDLLGYYAHVLVSFDDGNHVHELHTYTISEHVVCQKYDVLFARMLVCAMEMQCNRICLDNNGSLHSKTIWKPSWDKLQQQVTSQSIDMTFELIDKLEAKMCDTETTLFVTFQDANYLLNNKSMFFNVSSLPLHTCALSNLELGKEKCFHVH